MGWSDVWSDIKEVLVGGLPALLDDPTASASGKTGSKTETIAPSMGVQFSLDPKILIYAGVAVGAILILLFITRK
jgi:hypothetical protein